MERNKLQKMRKMDHQNFLYFAFPNTICLFFVMAQSNERVMAQSNKLAWVAHVALMTWWLRVRYMVEANFLSDVLSPLISAEAC